MRFLFRILVSALILAPVAVGEDKWHLAEWPYRHVVEVVSPDPTGQINTALAALDTAGKTREDGADARVVDAERGDAANHRVESVDGSTLKVRFEVADPSALRYHVYYGKQDAQDEAKDWEERVGGLKVATYVNDVRQTPRNLRHMRQLLSQAKTKVGEGPRRAIDDVANPFGEPADHFLSVYEGKIFCREDGEYAFATNSDDSSFLLVNDRLVAQRPGPNDPLNDFEMKGGRGGTVQLSRGIHSIAYYHAELTGDQLARAGWKPPWGRRLETIPEDVFIKELRVDSVARQARDKALNAYFSHVQSDAVEFAGVERRFVTLAFRSRATGRFGEPVLWEWNFGDGTVSRSENPSHMYKKEGVYTVRLTCIDKYGYRDTCEREIEVEAQNPARLAVNIEAEAEQAVLKPEESIRLKAKYRCSGGQTWDCDLVMEAVSEDGRLVYRAAERAPVTPRRWVTRVRELAVREQRVAIRLSLRFEGVTLASQTVHVIAPELIGDSLKETNGVFMNEMGELVVLRLSRKLDAPQVPSLAERLQSQDRAVVCIVDDSLAPAGDDDSEFSYYSVMRRELGRRFPDKELVVARVGAEFVSHHNPLRRLGQAPRRVAEMEPDLVVLAASMRDLANYVPVEQFEMSLYAMADRLRGCTTAEIVLVTPPPFVLNRQLSEAYAERTLRVGLMRGLKLIDVYSDFARLGEDEWQKLFQDPTEPDVLYLYPNAKGQERIGRLIARSVAP